MIFVVYKVIADDEIKEYETYELIQDSDSGMYFLEMFVGT